MKRLILFAIIAALVVSVFKLREQYPVDKTPQLTQELSNSLVFVEGKKGAGSGFICSIGGRKFVITNQHVIAGIPGARFTMLDQSPIKTGQAAAAVGHDIMSFALLSDANAVEIMTEVETNAAIGDEVAVLGNADGERVIMPLTGKLVGVGPDRVEVSAEFVHGNSGSPIIHVKSGKVIGIATYAKVRTADSLTGATKDEPVTRRFGYRLDSVKQWQPVNLALFNAEFQSLEKIKGRSTELLKTLKAASSTDLEAVNFSDPLIRSALTRFWTSLNGHGLIKTTPRSALQDLLSTLRNSCDTDITQAQASLKYDYFRRELGEEKQKRGLFYKEFDRFVKAMHGQ